MYIIKTTKRGPRWRLRGIVQNARVVMRAGGDFLG